MADSIPSIKPAGSRLSEAPELAASRRVPASPSFSLPPTGASRLEDVPRLDAPAKADTPSKAAPVPKAEAPDPTSAALPFQNVHLRFKIDPDTNDLTVLMIDNASHRVVRTIPPDELRSLKEGELVQLLA